MSLIPQTKKNNYAFIDSQNLNLAIRDQGWVLDFSKFRSYLTQKHNVNKAFLFIGYLPENEHFYNYLKSIDYICIFKPTLKYKDGTVKGNCDAELVLQTMIEYNNYTKAVIVSGDGDFYCLADYLLIHNKLAGLIIPNKYKYSSLLRKFSPLIKFLNFEKDKLKTRP